MLDERLEEIEVMTLVLNVLEEVVGTALLVVELVVEPLPPLVVTVTVAVTVTVEAGAQPEVEEETA